MKIDYANEVLSCTFNKQSSSGERDRNSDRIVITTAWSAHPVVRVLVLAPNPLSGPSPGRLAGSVFALDSSAKAGPSLGLLVVVGDDHCCTRSIGPRCTHRALCFPPGGVCWLGELLFFVEAHQYVDVSI